MQLNVNSILLHRQRTNVSCIPMSVECVLKLLALMPQTDFKFQDVAANSGQSHWVKDLVYPSGNPKIKFSRQFLLSDYGMEDRGPHFMRDHFENLFTTIDEELANERYVIISVQSGPSQWHMEIIYNKQTDTGKYEVVTFYHDGQGAHLLPAKDLRQVITEMQGTDILTYEWIKQN